MVLTIGALEPARFDAVIRANYSANADIFLDRRDGVIAVKESVLTFEGEETYVEVETAPQTFERRKVRTGLSDGIRIEVVEGLAGPRTRRPAGGRERIGTSRCG